MRHEVITLLKKAVKKTKRRKGILITLAMQELLKDQNKYQREVGRIENQARFDEEAGLPIPKKRVKVRFLEGEYLYFQDAKRVFLRSISHLIAVTIFTYKGAASTINVEASSGSTPLGTALRNEENIDEDQHRAMIDMMKKAGAQAE